ncbi:MAG: hypothetical protein HKN40_13115 [Winogradskyella sp.]|uniref:hypothetical protein n=1 Tax=Winogradskyella sp. TaxID=1883156 RepID=UPI00185B8719|nr:hypothetical protein [Winogradskyella sp.]
MNSIGTIVRNDETDNLVFMQSDDGLVSLGELGGEIDINQIYSNLLDENMETADGMWSPFKFRNLVKNGGDWDYKNQKGTIYGLGNDGSTTFLFEGISMESQDIGNHHFGAVA